MGCGASTPKNPQNAGEEDEPLTTNSAAPQTTNKTPPGLDQSPPPPPTAPTPLLAQRPAAPPPPAFAPAPSQPAAAPLLPEDDLHLPRPKQPFTSSDAAAQPEPYTPTAPVILVLGGPGSGKDTVCDRLVAKYGCAHFSANELLRNAVTASTQQGTMISNMIQAGQILPAQVTLDLLKAAMRETKGPYLVQGYPKTMDSLEALDAQCGGCTAAVHLDAGEAAVTERIVERGKTSMRTDDTPDAIARRFRTFQLQSMPVVDELTARGLVTAIDAAQPINAVFDAACAVYERVLPQAATP